MSMQLYIYIILITIIIIYIYVCMYVCMYVMYFVLYYSITSFQYSYRLEGLGFGSLLGVSTLGWLIFILPEALGPSLPEGRRTGGYNIIYI